MRKWANGELGKDRFTRAVRAQTVNQENLAKQGWSAMSEGSNPGTARVKFNTQDSNPGTAG